MHWEESKDGHWTVHTLKTSWGCWVARIHIPPTGPILVTDTWGQFWQFEEKTGLDTMKAEVEDQIQSRLWNK